MADLHVLANAPLRNWKWSPAEKKVARRAFDLTLDRELETVIREAKERTERIEKASDLWEMEGWLHGGPPHTGDRHPQGPGSGAQPSHRNVHARRHAAGRRRPRYRHSGGNLLCAICQVAALRNHQRECAGHGHRCRSAGANGCYCRPHSCAARGLYRPSTRLAHRMSRPMRSRSRLSLFA